MLQKRLWSRAVWLTKLSWSAQTRHEEYGKWAARLWLLAAHGVEGMLRNYQAKITAWLPEARADAEAASAADAARIIQRRREYYA